MAVVNAKSTQVQNADAAVQTLSPGALNEGKAVCNIGNIAKAASDNDGSTYRIMRVHTSWRIISIWLMNDVVFTSAAGWTVGLYRTAADGGAVVAGKGACYFTGWAPTAINMVGSEYSFGAGARSPSVIGQQVWQDAGYTADPNLWLDLVVVATTASAVAGNISWNIEHIKA